MIKGGGTVVNFRTGESLATVIDCGATEGRRHTKVMWAPH
jgi:hypothetical protein